MPLWNPLGGTGGSGSSTTISSVAPVSPAIGDWWFNTNTAELCIWYNDGNTTQWVAVSGPAGTNGTVGTNGTSGVIVDRAYAELATYTTITAVIPVDDTIPQVGEGTQILSAAITPKSVTNRIRARFMCSATGTKTGGTGLTAAMFVNGASNAVRTGYVECSGANFHSLLGTEHEYVPGSTSAQTITIRCGVDANTMYINGNSSGRMFGGSRAATLVLEEITA